MSSAVSGERKVRQNVRMFRAQLKIQQLDNVPPGHSRFFCVWKMPRKLASPHSGVTSARIANISEVQWDAEFQFSVRISSSPFTPERLLPCFLTLRILESKPKTKKPEKIGTVRINLSENAGVGRITQRLLLDESRLNSMLKLSLQLSQTLGDRIFRRPTAAASSGNQQLLRQHQQQHHQLHQKRNDADYDSDDDGFVGDLGDWNFGPDLNGIQSTTIPKLAAVADAFDQLPLQRNNLLERRLKEIFRDEIPDYVLSSRVDPDAAIDRILGKINLRDYDQSAKTDATAATLDMNLFDTSSRMKGTMEPRHSRTKSGDFAETLKRRMLDRSKSRSSANYHRVSSSFDETTSALDEASSDREVLTPRTNMSSKYHFDESEQHSEVEDKDKSHLDIAAMGERNKSSRNTNKKEKTRFQFEEWDVNEVDPFISIQLNPATHSNAPFADASFSGAFDSSGQPSDE